MAKKVQLMTNAKEWQTVDGVEVLIDVPQEDLDPITDSSCVEIEGHRTLEETISQENMFTPEIVETKVHSKVGGVYHDNVVDGAYEEAILYGNTQVNLVESVTTSTKYIPHSFTSFQGNESKIGNYNSGRTNQVAPLVKGVTMVNLCQETNVIVLGGGAVQIYNVKGNTLYSLFFTYTAKNTNAGITIQSFKDETYLENTKIQTNLSDKVVMTFTTHEQASKIHICNGTEFGGETIQLDNVMLIEGDVTDLDLPFFKGMRSVELSRPLTNLFTDNLDYRVTTNVVVTNSGGTITTTSQSITTWSCSAFYLNVKPNTEYLVMWDSLSYTHTDTTTQSTICVYGDSKNIGVINNTIKCPTLRSLTFNSAEYETIELRFHATASNSETGVTTVTGLRVFEWDDSLRTLDLQTIGYFSGTKYVSARALETEGKNLYPYGDVNFTSSGSMWYDAKGNNNMYGDIASKSQSRFLLRKGTYTLSIGSTENIEQYGLVDDKEGTYSNTFTLQQDTYMTLRVKRINADTLTTATNIQIERGDTATTYEVYQSRYYKPRETEEIILRSLPNGVCDTFNLQTGELVQRIYCHVFDGATYELNFMNKPAEVSGDNVTGGWSSLYNAYAPKHNSVSISCDIPTRQRTTSYDADYVNKEFFMIGINTFIISLSKTRLNGLSIGQYLTRNPITVQYELAEPIITKLQTYDRIYNGQTNALVGIGNNLSALTYRYSTDYLKVGNLSPVPAILEPITSIPYDVRLKPSTLYTIKYSRGGNSNSMKFDLGGSVVEKTNTITDLTGIAEELTVKTPAILSYEQLILSGTGFAFNLVVAEGDITGTELPYFKGMKDVKMPIVKNIGKNLLKGFHEWNFKAESQKPNITIINDYTATLTNVCRLDSNKIKNIQGKTVQLSFNGGRYYILELDKLGNEIRSNMVTTSPKILKIGHDTTYVQISLNVGTSYTFPLTTTYPQLQIIDNNNAVDVKYSSYQENSVYAVQGEIPFTEDMFEQGGFNGTNKKGQSYDNCKVSTNESIRIRTKDLIPVKPNTQYTISNQTSPNLNHVFYCFDGNRNYLEKQAEVNASSFTTTDDCYYVSLMFSKNNNANLSTTEFKQEQFRMYELDSTINLRSLPNGVKDELNLLTGEYIQRVGEIVLDGSEDEGWQVAPSHTGGAVRMETLIITGLFPNTVEYNIPNIVNNKYNVHSFTDIYQGRVSNAIGVHTNTHIVVQDNEHTNVDTFKQHLQSNPITVQYELAEPIISYPRIVSNTQEREVGVKLPNGVCNTYNPSTGITTVRVGKIVLDGSENWDVYDQAPSNLDYFRLPIPTMFSTGNMNADKEIECKYIVSDTFPTVGYYQIQKANSTINYSVISGMYSSSLGVQCLYVYYKPSADLATFKTYLASNPITVWYELKYPQIQPDIVLPNGVHDEYNPETGVYTKKVGFIEFDGSEDWHTAGEDILIAPVNGAVSVYNTWTEEPLPNAKVASWTEERKAGLCDSLQFKNAALDQTNEEFYFISNTGRLNMNLSRSKLTEATGQALKTYLSQNPIKLWYELATPITYQLTPYFGLPQPYAYENGYLIHDSAYAETTLPPEFKYKLVANRTGQVMQNNRKLQEHTTRLSDLEALIIEATIESLFNRELQTFELELMDIQLIDLGE